MKNIVFLPLLLLFTAVVIPGKMFAQLQQAPLSNIEGNAHSITSKLKTALSLTEVQQPKILEVVKNFLQQRATILPLKNSNPNAYDTKLKSYHNSLHRKLRAILKPEQFTGFLEQKPVNNDMTNVLSQLYY
jgi:hypothetical protein